MPCVFLNYPDFDWFKYSAVSTKDATPGANNYVQYISKIIATMQSTLKIAKYFSIATSNICITVRGISSANLSKTYSYSTYNDEMTTPINYCYNCNKIYYVRI